MFYSQNLKEMRQFYLNTWNKKHNQSLSDLEKKIIHVLEMHPEYQKYICAEYLESTFEKKNPFLHLGLHLAIQEQIQTNRPIGIQSVYLKLTQKYSNQHDVEHIMMEVLQFFVWEAQQQNKAPDEQQYIEKLSEL